MATSLVKFTDRKTSNGQKLFWSRADLDGLPFRGPAAPLFTEEEYEQRAVRVADYKNDFFDVTVPEQNKAFLQVMECCCNGWYKLQCIERFWNKTTKHYLEWAEYFMEDGQRTPFLTAGSMEVEAGGQGPMSQYFGQGADGA